MAAGFTQRTVPAGRTGAADSAAAWRASFTGAGTGKAMKARIVLLSFAIVLL